MNIVNAFYQRVTNNTLQAALAFKDKNHWVRYTWQDVGNLVSAARWAIADLGIQPGDKIAIMSDTRHEWFITDMAILTNKCVTVPVYPNSQTSELEFILNDSEAKMVFVGSERELEKLETILQKCPTIKQIVVFSAPTDMNLKHLGWREFLAIGRDGLADSNAAVPVTVTTSDPATLLYTSGTTGQPKGVLLTHAQIESELDDVFNTIPVSEADQSLSFLPYSHILGRIEAWGAVHCGYTLYFAESLEKLMSNIKETQPTFLIAVPRIFEKIYAGVLAQVENSKIKKRIFTSFLNVGHGKSQRLVDRKRQTALSLVKEKLAAKAVFEPILNQLGKNLRFAFCGGAPLSPDIARFFHAMGLLICEGYGLTETTAAITANTPLHYRFGSVGKPLRDVELKIADDGEILVKSKKVMAGYHKDPAATASAFEGDFFKTGDIGYIDDDGFLFLTDRKKDLIKTAGGKYVAPQKLEGLLKVSPLISHVLIHGDQKKYVVALVTLNQTTLLEMSKTHDLDLTIMTATEIARDSLVNQWVRDVVANANEQLSSFESIKKFMILPFDFSVVTGELTASLKVRRRFCDEKFKDAIESLY
jgi:long-chain acyl-CoA synthetase